MVDYDYGYGIDDPEILKKVEAKEFRERCLAVDVCPKCGGDLDWDSPNDGLVNKICEECNTNYLTHVGQ